MEAPIELVERLRFKNHRRGDSPRLRRLERSIRDRGFTPRDPIIVRVGRQGRWVVIDGGHRLTAARRVSHEFWTNLFGPKVKRLYFLVCLSDRSRKTRPFSRKR